jgi:hypothetical protein
VSEAQLLAIVAAIVYNGRTINPDAPGYNPKQAVEVAREILSYAKTSTKEDEKS